MRDGFLLAADEIFYSHLRPFVAENDGQARAALLGQSELARYFRRRQGVIDSVSAITQLLHHGNGISTLLFFRDDDINLDRAFGLDRFFHLRASSGVAANHFTEDDVANGEAQRGHGNGVVA